MERKEKRVKEKEEEKREKVVLGKVLFVFHDQFCGLLPVNLLAACHSHSLKRERWGLLCFGLKPGRVERGLKEGGFD